MNSLNKWKSSFKFPLDRPLFDFRAVHFRRPSAWNRCPPNSDLDRQIQANSNTNFKLLVILNIDLETLISLIFWFSIYCEKIVMNDYFLLTFIEFMKITDKLFHIDSVIMIDS